MPSKPIIVRKGGSLAARVAALALALAWAGGVPAQVLLSSENFDEDASGWTSAGAPGGQVVWDGFAGSPEPGSLAVIAPAGGDGGQNFKAVGQCRDARPDQAYGVQAEVRAGLGSRRGSCFVTPVFYEAASCQGDGSTGGSGDLLPDADWTSQIRSQTSFHSSVSMRVELVMAVDAGDAQATCHFDSVRLYEGRLRQLVPALAPPWLAALVLAIAITAALRGLRSG